VSCTIRRSAAEFYRDCGVVPLAGLFTVAVLGGSCAVTGDLPGTAAYAACAVHWAWLGCLRVRRVRRDPAQAWRLGVLAAARLAPRATYIDPAGEVALTCLRSRTGTLIITNGPGDEPEPRRSGQARHPGVLSRAYLIRPGSPRVQYSAAMITVSARDDGTVTSASTQTRGQPARGRLIRAGNRRPVRGGGRARAAHRADPQSPAGRQRAILW